MNIKDVPFKIIQLKPNFTASILCQLSSGRQLDLFNQDVSVMVVDDR